MPPRKVEESAPAREQDDDGQQKEQRVEEKRVDTAAQDIARERVRSLDSVRALLNLTKLMFSFWPVSFIL
jgi:hypothetical protein